MINLTLLHHALTIAEQGSFAAAAKSLGLTQPTLSRQIGALELSLGLRLFDRGRGGAIATPLGQQVLTRASELVRGAGLLQQEINQLRGVELGSLRVAAGPYPANISLGTALGRFAARHPRLHISVVVEDWRTLANEVMEARLDLAIAELSGYVGHPSLEVEALPEHQGVVICRTGHPLLDLAAPTLADIFAYPYAGTRIAPRIVEILGEGEFAGQVDEVTGEYVPSIEVNTISMAIEAIACSDAFGLVPLFALGDLVGNGRLQTLPLQLPWLKTRYGFITLRDRTLSPAAAAFMAEVRAVESEIAVEELCQHPSAPPPKRASKKQ